ncbi:MAG: hypothetical protein ACPGGK_13075 [Pikeienuella sp.]
MEYQKFDDLDYAPAYGTVDVSGRVGQWSLPVSIKQGRAMEADGIPVCWVYGAIPAWAAIPVLGPIALAANRVFLLPSRITK